MKTDKVFQGLRGYLLKAGKESNYSLECAGTGQPRTAEYSFTVHIRYTIDQVSAVQAQEC